MKNRTFFLLLLILVFLGSCTRNPLGEDLKQPILNLSFSLTQSCTNTFNQDTAYNCPIVTSEVVASVVYSFDSILTTCTWASINSTTGIVTGTPNDDQVGNCQIVVNAANAFRSAPAYTYAVSVVNVAPTLTIADAANILESDPAAVIRDNVAVQASEEGFGLYSFDHATTTLPRCFDNAATLTIDPNTGAVTFAPTIGYFGICNIKVAFDDGNAVANSIVSDEFAIQVLNINSPPVLSAIGPQVTNEDIPVVINFTITDPDNTLTCAGSMTAASSNLALVHLANIVFAGAAPNCTATVTPVLNANGVVNLSVALSPCRTL